MFVMLPFVLVMVLLLFEEFELIFKQLILMLMLLYNKFMFSLLFVAVVVVAVAPFLIECFELLLELPLTEFVEI